MKRKIMENFMQGLSPDEASRVLMGMLDGDPELLKKAYGIALKVADDVDAFRIMNDVFNELESLELDALAGRSGRTRHGYVEPTDAAWEIFEESLEPFIVEMRKNQQRALPAAAKAYCIGIVKGLWRYEEESRSDFSEWVTDAPGEYICTVVEEWKKGNPSSEDISEVEDIAKGGLT